MSAINQHLLVILLFINITLIFSMHVWGVWEGVTFGFMSRIVLLLVDIGVLGYTSICLGNLSGITIRVCTGGAGIIHIHIIRRFMNREGFVIKIRMMLHARGVYQRTIKHRARARQSPANTHICTSGYNSPSLSLAISVDLCEFVGCLVYI